MEALKAPEIFREELQSSTGGGPDFPGSAGDRERGKFRPSATPRRTTVAVVDDDGQSVGEDAGQVLRDILLYQKAILVALLNLGEDFSAADALAEASKM